MWPPVDRDSEYIRGVKTGWRVVLGALAAASTACSGGGDGDGPRDGGPAGSCEAPFVLCGGACVLTSNNPSHCGGCDLPCAESSFCDNGMCVAICAGGLEACGAACTNLDTDRTHCGRCDRACPMDRDCVGGACVCPPDLRDCNGTCVDVVTDRKHCGQCGRVCGADQFCSMGECQCMSGNREASCDNGADDDCDTLVDCMDPDCVGATRACMGMCGAGTETCQAGGTWAMCVGGDGSAEICGDGIDQDCSGGDLRMPDAFEPNDSCAACKLIQADPDPDLTLTGSFDSIEDDVDCFKFNADDSNSYREHIRISLTNVPAGADYDIYLYASQGRCESLDPLASSENASNDDEFIEWGEAFGSDDSGTYFIEVRRFSGHSCTESYSLAVDGLD